MNIQRQYSAFKELEHFIQVHEKSGQESHDSSSLKYLAALKVKT